MKSIIKNFRKWIIPALIILVVSSGAFYLVFGQSFKMGKSLPEQSTGHKMPEEVRNLVQTISNKTKLPPEEIPNVATVSDVSKLSDQAFFAKAQNGDKVLIYPLTKLAVLYRPTTGKVIHEAPLEIVDDEAATSSATTVLSATDSASTSSSPAPLRVRM